MPKKTSQTVSDAQKSVEQTASIMEHLFRAPKPISLVLPILVISLIFGMLISDDPPNFYTTFFINGFVILALPTYLSFLISVPVAESLGGKLYMRRSMLMSFLSLLILVAVLVILQALMPAFDTSIDISNVLIFGYSATIWLRHLSLVTTSNSSHLRSLPASLIQPVLGFMVIALFISPFGTREGVLALISLVIFLFSVVLLTVLVTSPMRRVFGVNGLTMVRYSLDHITEGGEEGSAEVEDFFKTFAEKMDVHLGLVSFKKGSELKSIMVVPSVHPGPFGSLGGSNLPSKLAESLSDICPAVLVPHGSATHDLNLASSDEKDKIAKTVGELLSKVTYSNSASRFIRVSESLDVCAQVFGDGVLLMHTSSPNPTDDVDYSTGSALREKVKVSVGKDSLFIDAHNCAEKGSGCIYFGSKVAYELIDLAQKTSKKAEDNKTEGIEVGFAQKLGYETEKGIGNCGIQVLVIQTDAQKVAYILFDGNNMVMGLRESIIAALKDVVDDAEVLTTDNHAVNASIGGFNPVGQRMDKEGLVKDVKALVRSAVNDLEKVKVGMVTGFVKDISVFGHENVARLSSTVNSTIAILKVAVLSSLLFAGFASALLLLLL